MTELLDAFPTVPVAALAFAVIFFGGLVQGSLGFGMGMVAIPILAMFIPERLPQTILLAAIPLTVFMLWQEREAVRLGPMTWLLAGRLLGVAPAIAVLAVVPERVLQVIFALATLVAVALLAANRLQLEITRGTQFGVGTFSGFIGTAAGLGAPPVALLYANQSGRALRATLALVLLVGNITSLTGFAVSGRLLMVDLVLSVAFLVPTLCGLALGVVVRRFLDGPRLRRAVLLLVTASGLALLVRALVG